MNYPRLLKGLTLKEKIGQMFMVGFKGKELSGEVKKFLRNYNIGFVAIFARNVETGEQVFSLTEDIHSTGKIPPMVFTDQEGGPVCQFEGIASSFTSAMGLAATGAPVYAEIAGTGIGHDLNLLGIDGVLAPVVDINREPDNPIIGVRAFSDEPSTVIRYATSFIDGVKKYNVAPVLKHFPGHGGAAEDSHLTLPYIEVTREYFEASDLQPFISLASMVDFIMSAHVVFPLIDPSGLPATFSKVFVNEYLRSKIRFDGVLITDCLEMNAIRERFSPEEMITLGINAGVDVFLVSHTPELQKQLFNILLAKVKSGEILEERIDASVSRILRIKEKYGLLERKKKEKFNPDSLKYNIERENIVCTRSITVLRDFPRKIPLPENAKPGIIEFEKVPSTIQISRAKRKSYLRKIAKEYFPGSEVLVLSLQNPDIEELNNFIKEHQEILVATYTRTPEAGRLQGEIVRKILDLKSDAIVVALANPYDIRHFPTVSTYILTYSFRDCSIKALFDVLSGRKEATGLLPVEIKNFFPRWFKFDG